MSVGIRANTLANTRQEMSTVASVHSRTNKDGSVVHRVMYRIDGRQAQDSFDDERAAGEFATLVERVGGRRAREVLLERDEDGNDTPTLTEWVAEYLDPASGLLTGVAKDTREKYVAIAAQSFLKELGDLPLSAITASAVRAWVNWQAEQKLARRVGTVSSKTIHNYHGLLSAVLNSAVQEKHIDSNPAFGISLPKGQRRPIEFITEKQFAKIYAHVPEFYQPMTLSLAGSGLRFGELTALTWRDLVEIDGGWCFDVNKAWKDGSSSRRWIAQPKSRAGSRVVSVSKEVAEGLGTPGRPGALIFESKLGNPISTHTFAKLGLLKGIDASGVPRRPRVHDLRHSHASWLIARNVPLPYIQRRLGHENVDTTVRVYGHLLPEALSSTRDAAADALRLALEDGGEDD